jgi:two-component system chemotaxis response regulator CheB
VARDGVNLLPGQILVAPGDAHLTLRSIGGLPRVLLNHDPAPSACLPSVDPMLEAVAEHFQERAFVAILSGMGRDGSIGARHIVEMGGEIAAQDQASSVIWGMPGSVASAGLASTVASPTGIAARIAERMGGRSLRRPPWK